MKLTYSCMFISRFKEWMADHKCKEVFCSVCSHKDGKGRMDGTYQQVYTRPFGKKWVFYQQLVFISVLKWVLALIYCQAQNNVLRLGYLTTFWDFTPVTFPVSITLPCKCADSSETYSTILHGVQTFCMVLQFFFVCVVLYMQRRL